MAAKFTLNNPNGNNVGYSYPGTVSGNSIVTSADFVCLTITPNNGVAFNVDIKTTAYCTSGSDAGKYIISKSSCSVVSTSGTVTLATNYSSASSPAGGNPLLLSAGHTLTLSGSTLSLTLLADTNAGNSVTYDWYIDMF